MNESPLETEVPVRCAGWKLDALLVELIEGRSKAQLQKLVRLGRVLLDGERVVRSNQAVRAGQRLLVHFTAPPERPGPGRLEHLKPTAATSPSRPNEARAPAADQLQFLHVDEQLIVICKPVGLLVQPNEKQQRDTVADVLVRRFGPITDAPRGEKAGLVHRLDRETSGILLAARTREAQLFLVNEFRQRRVEKRYLALVHGLPKSDRFQVDQALAAHPKYADIQRPDRNGAPAFTAFEVLERFPRAAAGEGRALVACAPKSGRRHQIRVHLAIQGHPIVGDKLYRPDGRSSASKELSHQALHAAAITIRHPATKELTSFEAPLPEDFQELLRSLRRANI